MEGSEVADGNVATDAEGMEETTDVPMMAEPEEMPSPLPAPIEDISISESKEKTEARRLSWSELNATDTELTAGKEFKKVVVEGDPVIPPFSYKPAKAVLDAHLPQAKLKVFCFDRTNGEPLPGVTVHINTLEHHSNKQKKNVARAFGNSSVSREDGLVQLQLMAGVPYVVTASCDRFHKFGSMGEHMVVTLTSGAVTERSLGLVPERITVMVTLRELRPLAGKNQKHDPFGQVNPLYSAPQVDPMALVTPQKVAFHSPEGAKLTFVAMPLMAHGAIGIAEQQGGQIGDYSTDSEGHCYFYGSKLAQKTRKYRDRSTTIDNAPWEYSNKYHLRANQESSPVKPQFDHFVEEVTYPAHVARHPPPTKALLNYSPDSPVNARTDRGRTAATNSASPPSPVRGGGVNSRRRSSRRQDENGGHVPVTADSIVSGLTEQFLSHHREIAEMVSTPPGLSQWAEAREPLDNNGPDDMVTELDTMRTVKQLEQDDPEGIHNHLQPGLYNMLLSDPSRLLVFYTYSPDNEQAEVNKAQNSIVPFEMPELESGFGGKHALNGRGKATINTRFPIQLYCRARPWFQIVVYDMYSLEEVGSQLGMPFTIHRIDINRSFRERVAKVKAAMMTASAGLLTNPHNLAEGQQDPEVAAFLEQQQKRGTLARLWAKAEVSMRAKESTAEEGYLTSTATIDGLPDGLERLLDSEVYQPVVRGHLDPDMERKLWITPGERYAVEVHCEDPCLELSMRQVRLCSWQLEPFVFYTCRKVSLLVGVRERYNQAPVAGITVTVQVDEHPMPQRPPIVKQDWCEKPATYAERIIDQLIDFIVQSKRPEATERVMRTLQGITDNEGIASIPVVPGSVLTVQAEVGEEFEAQDASGTLTVSREKTQFLGFSLERICYVRVCCVDCETGEAIQGFTIKAYDVTDLVSGMPNPTNGLNPEAQARAQPQQEASLAEQTVHTRIAGLQPVHTSQTGSDGMLLEPLTIRAGRVVKVVVAGAPKGFLLPYYLDSSPASNATMVYAYNGTHAVTFRCPPKPKVKVVAEDACTLEPVSGVRFRVFVRRLQLPYVPEGEEEAAAAAEGRKLGWRQQAGDLGLSLTAIEEPELDAGSIDECRPRSDGGEEGGEEEGGVEEGGEEEAAEGVMEEDPGPIQTLTGKDQVYWDGQDAAAAGAPGRNEVPKGADTGTGLNAQVLELLSGMEAPPPAARGPMRRRVEEVESWAESSATNAAAAQAEAEAAAAAAEAAADMAWQGTLRSGTQRTLTYEPSEAPTTPRRTHVMAAPPSLSGFDADDDAAKANVSAPEEADVPAVWSAPLPASKSAAGGATPSSSRRSRLGPPSASLRSGTGRPESGSRRSALGDGTDDQVSAHLQKDPEAEVPSMGKEASFAFQADEQEVMWYDTYTGYPGMDEILVDADTEVRVQLLPCWPYMTQHQELTRRPDVWRSPPDFLFYLARNNEAFQFWLDRDRSMHAFWGEDGTPLLPPHPLSRLQPAAPAGALAPSPIGPWVRLLSRPAAAALEPAAAAAAVEPDGALEPDAGTPPEGSAVLDVDGSEARSHQEGAEAEGSVELAGSKSRRTNTSCSGSGRAESAVQFDEEVDNVEEVRAAAWTHMRLSDVKLLPVDTTRLLSLLVKWGAFPHIQGGLCKGCLWPQPSPSQPFLMAGRTREQDQAMSEEEQEQPSRPLGRGTSVRWASPPTEGNGAIGGANAVKWASPRSMTEDGDTQGDVDVSAGASGAGTKTAARGGFFKSQLFGSGAAQLSAPWVLDTVQWAQQHKQMVPPHLAPHAADKFARTHAINARSEATYCSSPFFTWRLPDGSAVHVGMHDNLYRDLVPLMDSVAASVEYMQQHVKKVEDHNATRTKHGRFLLGHMLTESCVGGVFVIDDSTAMPHGAALFMLGELASTFDYWYSQFPDEPPQYNIMLVSGDSIMVMHEALSPVTASNLEDLQAWYQEARAQLDITAAGFDIAQVLRQSLAIADTQVPTVLICGGMLALTEEQRARSQNRISKALYEVQVACINRQRPLQPIFTTEIFPIPKIEDPGASPQQYGNSSSTARDGSPAAASSAEQGMHGGAMEDAPKARHAGHVGADIFERLQEALATGRMRLLEVFKETDKDGDGSLSSEELLRLVQRLVPEAGPAHMRYLQLMLDATGNHLVSYKELSTVVKAASKGGISLDLGDKLEVTMVLQRIAFLMLLNQKTIEEVFAAYDHNKDGFWDQVEQWRALKDLFPSLSIEEQRQMFAAMQALDINQDDRISRDEFTRAMSRGGAAGLTAWGMSGPGSLPGGGTGPRQTMEEEEEAGAAHLQRVQREAALMEATRLARFPLTGLLRSISLTTRASHRRLDMGKARTLAEVVNLEPLSRLRSYLERSLQTIVEFERAYGERLTADRGNLTRNPGRSTKSTKTSPPFKGGGGTGSTPNSAPSSTIGAAIMPRVGRGTESELGQRPKTGSRSRSASRPRSAPLRRANSSADIAGPAVSSRLLDTTASRAAYAAELAAKRGEAPTSLLQSFVSRRRSTFDVVGGSDSPRSDIGVSTDSRRPALSIMSERASPRPKSAASPRPASLSGAPTSPDIAGPRREYIPPSSVAKQTSLRERPKSAPHARPARSARDPLPLPVLLPPTAIKARRFLPLTSMQIEFQGPVHQGGWGGRLTADAVAGVSADPFVSKRQGPAGFNSVALGGSHNSALLPR